jgi:hypothetical protein
MAITLHQTVRENPLTQSSFNRRLYRFRPLRPAGSHQPHDHVGIGAAGSLD